MSRFVRGDWIQLNGCSGVVQLIVLSGFDTCKMRCLNDRFTRAIFDCDFFLVYVILVRSTGADIVKGG